MRGNNFDLSERIKKALRHEDEVELVRELSPTTEEAESQGESAITQEE